MPYQCYPDGGIDENRGVCEGNMCGCNNHKNQSTETQYQEPDCYSHPACKAQNMSYQYDTEGDNAAAELEKEEAKESAALLVSDKEKPALGTSCLDPILEKKRGEDHGEADWFKKGR